MYHLKNNNMPIIFFSYLNSVWIKFIVTLLAYFIFLLLINLFFENFTYGISKNLVSLLVSIMLFPLFYTITKKLSQRFGRLND